MFFNVLHNFEMNKYRQRYSTHTAMVRQEFLWIVAFAHPRSSRPRLDSELMWILLIRCQGFHGIPRCLDMSEIMWSHESLSLVILGALGILHVGCFCEAKPAPAEVWCQHFAATVLLLFWSAKSRHALIILICGQQDTPKCSPGEGDACCRCLRLRMMDVLNLDVE